MSQGNGYLSAGMLRRKAEAIVQQRKQELRRAPRQQLEDLVHELQVHQIELELQNEELQRTQQALEMAHDEYVRLYNGAPAGYFTVDGDGLITRANAAGEALVAAQPGALLGRRFHSLVAREDQDAYHFFLLHLLHSRDPEAAELFLVRSDGSRFRARLEGVVSAAEGQDGYRWRAAVSDVTAEYEARQALQRYADEQSALYTVAAALATSDNPPELAEAVLDALRQLFGAPASWILVDGGASADPLQVLAYQGIDAEVLELALATCPGCAGPLPGGPEGGAGLPTPIYCEPEPESVLTQAGLRSLACLPLAARDRVVGTLTLAWDREHKLADRDETLLVSVGRQVAVSLDTIYQQARQVDHLKMLVALERALAESLDLETAATLALERIAASVHVSEAFLLPYATWLHDDSGQVLALGEGWADLSASDAYGRWKDLLEGLRRAQTRDGDVPRPISRSTTPWGNDLVVVPIDQGGDPLADLVLSGPALDDDDVAVAHVAASQAGQALRNARLYGEVRDLLRQQQETQALLIQTEKVAALGRLSASLSHEINNPLQSVLGCLALAQGKLDSANHDEALVRYLSVATQEIRRIAVLVHRMREFYTQGRKERIPGDVEEVLRRVVDLTEGEFKGRKVLLEWERGGRLPPVPMHADQVQQVFLNLILNAAEAMPGGGTLTLHTGLDTLPPADIRRPAPAVRIDVQDTGLGMPPKVQERLFEPFFTTKESGSGLGLYVCHHIVREHGGEIGIQSQEGKGTTATVWLPIDPAS